MPLLKRKRALEEEKKSLSKRLKHSQTLDRKLIMFDNISYKADRWHTLLRELPDDIDEFKKILCRHVGSFLNGAGGILCFGCRSNGRIYGEKISRKEEDNLRLLIDDTMKRFEPFVPPSKYRVNFTKVDSGKTDCERCVLEIKVNSGDPYIMYEDEFHEVYVRSSDRPKGPLTPHQIKDHVTKLYMKKLKDQSKQPLRSSEDEASSSKKAQSSSSKGKPTALVHPLEKCMKAEGCVLEKKDSASKLVMEPVTDNETPLPSDFHKSSKLRVDPETRPSKPHQAQTSKGSRIKAVTSPGPIQAPPIAPPSVPLIHQLL